MAKVLIIEDDIDLAGMVTDWLKFEHYTVEHVYNGAEGLSRLQASAYDIVIVDWDLPGMSGVEICREFRTHGGTTPMIMLTGKDKISDKEESLDSGIDDYLTKPFNMKELSARIRAILRRPSGLVDNVLKVRDIEMEPTKYWVKKGGVEIQLLPKEFSVLEFFLRHPNQVFSADALIQRVWVSDTEATGDAIRTCLKRLRKKLDDNDDADPIIQTVHGVGYRFRA
jgi:DNA-binding response OmpR family regulator